MPVSILLPAGEIPLGATVTKRTGVKEYKLLDKLRVFPISESRAKRLERQAQGVPWEGAQEIKAQAGTRFLVCDGDANAISTSTILVWKTTKAGVANWLRGEPYVEEDDAEDE